MQCLFLGDSYITELQEESSHCFQMTESFPLLTGKSCGGKKGEAVEGKPQLAAEQAEPRRKN